LSEGQKPSVGPDLRRYPAAGSVFSKAGFHVGRLSGEDNPVILEEPVKHTPGFPHGQGLAVHDSGSRHQAQESQLREAGKSDIAGFLFPPCTSRGGMNVFGCSQGQPYVHVRED